jgi:hypothetical protein
MSLDDASNAYVRPFGQSDIAFLFVEGIVEQYITFLRVALSGILNDKSTTIVKEYVRDDDERIVEVARQEKDNGIIVKQFIEGFENFRQEELVQKLMDVIVSLPKEEMAALAHAIVELTSLRRKIESHVESVGGPVDVAVISKSDGFISIKRKHYFDIDFN